MENGHAPATEQDLRELEGRLVQANKNLKDELVESMRDIQTETLKAFYAFAESNRQRVT